MQAWYINQKMKPDSPLCYYMKSHLSGMRQSEAKIFIHNWRASNCTKLKKATSESGVQYEKSRASAAGGFYDGGLFGKSRSDN